MIDNGFPVEVSDSPIYMEYDIRWIESELAQQNADLKEENKLLTKAFDNSELEIDRLRAENDRLKQELAELRELSLF